MTIKKSIKAAAPVAASESPAVGGATIADRFKLDIQDPAAKPAKKGGGVAALVAMIAGLLALGVAGILTFVIYQHWEFLKAA